GLNDGILAEHSAAPETADTCSEWSKEAGFRVRVTSSPDEEEGEEWHFEDDFVLRRDDEGDAREWLAVEHFKSAAQGEEARSISNPQELAAHQDWAVRLATRIAKGVHLPAAAVSAVAVGARLHDEGKKAPRWQRAFKAPRDAAKY